MTLHTDWRIANLMKTASCALQNDMLYLLRKETFKVE